MTTRTEIDVLRDEIKQFRTELGDTVQALAERADVPARVRAARTRIADRARHVPVPWLVLAGVAAGVAAAVALAIARGRQR